MEQSTEGEVERWTAKRKAALVSFVVSTHSSTVPSNNYTPAAGVPHSA